MILKKRKLKKIISNYLNESWMDDVRYPCNDKFLQSVASIIYETKFGKNSYLGNTFEAFYEYILTIYPRTKISFEDAQVVLYDHYENFENETQLFGDSTGVMQIKPQGIVDAYRTEGYRYYDAAKHGTRSKAIRSKAKDVFKNDKPALSILNSVDNFLAGKIDGDTVLKEVGNQLGDSSQEFIMFSGLCFLMMPGVNSIVSYVAKDGKTISATRSNRHEVIRKLLNLEKDELINFTKYELLSKYKLKGDITPTMIDDAVIEINK